MEGIASACEGFGNRTRWARGIKSSPAPSTPRLEKKGADARIRTETFRTGQSGGLPISLRPLRDEKRPLSLGLWGPFPI